MKEEKKYLALFDLDLTILNINSGSALVRESRRQGLLNTKDFIRAIWYSVLYKLRLRKPKKIISRMGLWLNGVKKSEIQDLCKQLVDNHLIKAIRPEILKEIDFHRKNNAELVILSSAIEDICNQISSYLKLDKVLCTIMETRDGILTGKPQGSYCFEDEKRLRLETYCDTKGHSLSEAFYYGDSSSDIPVLEIVGNPVCVSPDKKLSKLALQKKWKIIGGQKAW